ncbi:MAG: hypothetical protein U9Q98_11410 [Bacteroidota bacterium]|nr:hypothetical protein [Bacteroidota bacterium]
MNSDNILKEMFSALKLQLGDEYKRAQKQIDIILEMREQRLKKLVDKRISGEISAADFSSYLEDENDALVAEFNTATVIGKAAAQRAVNAALNVLNNAIDKALGAL